MVARKMTAGCVIVPEIVLISCKSCAEQKGRPGQPPTVRTQQKEGKGWEENRLRMLPSSTEGALERGFLSC